MKKKILSVITAIAMVASLTACGGSKVATEATTADATVADATTADAVATTTDAAKSEITGAGVSTEGKLIMATNAEFAPYEYHDNNEIVGIDVEIAKAIAEKMGLELEIEDIAFDSIIPEITSGKADIGAAGMTVTEDRMKNVDFSDTYAHAAQVIIVKSDSTIKSADDLKDMKIGVQLGTTGDLYASGDFGDENVERFAKGFEAVQALSQGKIDAVIIDREPAKIFSEETEGLTILDESYTDEDYAISVKKGNTELLDNINAAIAELKADGTLDSIVAKYIKAE